MNLTSSDRYISRRSPVLSRTAMVASSQPLATLAGHEILRGGGTAADAAVAVAAALQVTQPCSTGLGGDAFCLYFEAASGTVHALNGSGRSAGELSLELARRLGFEGRIPPTHGASVTVPGAPAAWADTVGRFGRLGLSSVLAPAIRLAEDGFPVSPLTALWWQTEARAQLSHHRHGGELLPGGHAPGPGEIVRLPNLAVSLRRLADEGPRLFYEGEIAGRIVEAVREAGGVLSREDLSAHVSEWVTPISTVYAGVRVWECPPNGHGLAALLALAIYGRLESRFGLESGRNRESASDPLRLHLMAEAMSLAFADAAVYVADPDHSPAPLGDLLSEAYAVERAGKVSAERKMENPMAGRPGRSDGSPGTDTVYFCVVDGEGNGCSFINSNFMGFGSGIVPRGCGFSLQSRGNGFLLEEGHPNCLAPRKRPYHTIIPGLVTRATGDERFLATFGVMGGMMQPQGHLQVIQALFGEGLDPQAALDRPRFQLEAGRPGGTVLLEDAAGPAAFEDLRKRGHEVRELTGLKRSLFGLGQIIYRDDSGVLWGGSDPRGDGCALGL